MRLKVDLTMSILLVGVLLKLMQDSMLQMQVFQTFGNIGTLYNAYSGS